MKTIDQLVARRKELCISEADVAARCNVSEDTIKAWEMGAQRPSLDDAVQWGEALDLDLAFMPKSQPGQHVIILVDSENKVRVEGSTARLTPQEQDVLLFLARSQELVTHEKLLRHLYGEQWGSRKQSTAVRVVITKLRRILPQGAKIKAKWGRGYIVTGVAVRHTHQNAAVIPSRSGEKRVAFCRGDPPSSRAPNPKASTFTSRPFKPTAPRPVAHPVASAPTPQQTESRHDELAVIERFLEEKGAERCPDMTQMRESPLPTLVWDKHKRKWVRPPG